MVAHTLAISGPLHNFIILCCAMFVGRKPREEEGGTCLGQL